MKCQSDTSFVQVIVSWKDGPQGKYKCFKREEDIWHFIEDQKPLSSASYWGMDHVSLKMYEKTKWKTHKTDFLQPLNL